MSEQARSFYAARLVDADYKIEFNLHKIKFETKESLVEAVESLKKENHTPEQINGMLGVILAHAGEMLTDEDKTTVFQGITPAESTDPFVIPLGSENYALLYNALRELTDESNDDTVKEDLPEAEADPNIKELTDSIVAKDAQIGELAEQVTKLTKDIEAAVKEGADVKGEYDPEGLKAKIAELEEAAKVSAAGADTTAVDEAVAKQTEELTKKIESSTTRVATLESLVAKLSTEKHEMLAREAAHLAIKANYPAAKGKGFDELCETMAARSQESLKDLITDLFPESFQSKAKVEVIDPEAVEKVTNPTATEETGIPAQLKAVAGENHLQTEMVNQIVEMPEETFRILNFSSKEKDRLRDKINKARQPGV